MADAQLPVREGGGRKGQSAALAATAYTDARRVDARAINDSVHRAYGVDEQPV